MWGESVLRVGHERRACGSSSRQPRCAAPRRPIRCHPNAPARIGGGGDGARGPRGVFVFVWPKSAQRFFSQPGGRGGGRALDACCRGAPIARVRAHLGPTAGALDWPGGRRRRRSAAEGWAGSQRNAGARALLGAAASREACAGVILGACGWAIASVLSGGEIGFSRARRALAQDVVLCPSWAPVTPPPGCGIRGRHAGRSLASLSPSFGLLLAAALDCFGPGGSGCSSTPRVCLRLAARRVPAAAAAAVAPLPLPRR